MTHPRNWRIVLAPAVNTELPRVYGCPVRIYTAVGSVVVPGRPTVVRSTPTRNGPYELGTVGALGMVTKLYVVMSAMSLYHAVRRDDGETEGLIVVPVPFQLIRFKVLEHVPLFLGSGIHRPASVHHVVAAHEHHVADGS